MHRLRDVLRYVLNPRSRLARVEGYPPGRIDAGMHRSRLRARDVLGNAPLMFGSLIVLALFVLVLFGPAWAPENPYVSSRHVVPHYDAQQKVKVDPPLPPSTLYVLGTDRWGNDLLSLLMHGARNTLIACSFITMVRVLLGLILGAVAGWNEGSLVDRLVMGTVGVTTAVPVLISSMILIYGLDIRRGLLVFIVALSAVGWTEIAQYIRGEFLVLRKAPYIDGARSVGLGGPGIVVRHILPNILPQLLVISFLEMAAVMMLLGELGFVGVYIGGGSRIVQEIDPSRSVEYTLIEVPEWGAMLADGYRWLRSRPFVIMPPAVAFFISVVGFNALGEGLRRLVEKRSLNTAFLLRPSMLGIVAALVAATVFILNNTGPAPWFARVAGAFDGERAYEHVRMLAQMEGRGAGQPGGEQAAAYITDRFREYGLEPGWKDASYVYPLPVRLVRPVTQPRLELVGEDGSVQQSFQHQVDFGFLTAGHGGSGQVEAALCFLSLARQDLAAEDYRGLDLRDRIVLVDRASAPPDLETEVLIRGARGILWVVGEGVDVHSQMRVDGQEALLRPQIPIFRIRPQVADALLAGQGLTWSSLLAGEPVAEEHGPGWAARDLSVRVRMDLALDAPQQVEVPCLLGYKPGSDLNLANELIVLYAGYDGLGVDPDGTIYSGAVQDASGVGMLLELARLWHDQALDARRPVLFVAWGADRLDASAAELFFRDDENLRYLPAQRAGRPTMLVQLAGLGAGGDQLCFHPGSSRRLVELFEAAASDVGTAAGCTQTGQGADVFVTRSVAEIHIAWDGASLPADEDSLARIDVDQLQAAGEVLSLALTRAARQTRY